MEVVGSVCVCVCVRVHVCVALCSHHHIALQEPGKLKLVPECIAFKSSKSGQVQQFNTSDIKSLGWMRVARGHELKVFLQNGKIVKFDGFKEAVRRGLGSAQL